MKRLLLLLLLAALGALVWTFLPQPLPTTLAVNETFTAPQPQPPAGMKLSVMHAGRMESNGLFAYRGGPMEKREFGMDVVVVEHPQGTLLFDAGFARDVAAQLHVVPALMRSVSKITAEKPVADQLAAAGVAHGAIKGIILTHAHWDHVSGLADLRDIPVWINPAELAFIHSGEVGAQLAAELDAAQALNLREYRFDGPAYWGFPASHDVFGDGSVVLVPGAGHTPGSTIAFVHTPDGKHYALIGDLAWQHEGVDLPAERPWLLRRMVDSDVAGVRDALVRLHLLHKAMPDLMVLPAHDRRVMNLLPEFGTGRQVFSPPPAG
ncbi:MAG TPA: MBL fold metallo-hydrolase [Fontimonas sp.]